MPLKVTQSGKQSVFDLKTQILCKVWRSLIPWTLYFNINEYWTPCLQIWTLLLIYQYWVQLTGCERIGRFYSRLVFKYPHHNLNFRLGFLGKSASCQPMGLVLRLVTSDNHFKKSGLFYVLKCLKKAKIKCIQRVTIFLPLNKTDEMIRMN